jgi:pimeloyl-ACP methyl ester carboxylesterase
LKEISHAFGSERHLVGTVSLPDHVGPVGFVIVNAGVIHRIGPHRWHVKLARHMAGLGFPTIRFDPAGQGDSRVPRDAASFKEQAVRDARAAMDHLANVAGVQRFVIGGICSGAETGFNTAAVDPRVEGLWMLDGFAFPTARTQWMRYALKLQSMTPRQALARVRHKLISRSKADAASALPNDAAPISRKSGDAPPADVFARKLQTLVDRGVSVYFLYSGSILHLFNHASQLHDRFAGQPFLKAIHLDYRPEIDHTVTTQASQQEMTRLVSHWAVRAAGQDLSAPRAAA